MPLQTFWYFNYWNAAIQKTDLPAERPARARSEVWPRSQIQSSRPRWVWNEPCHNLWASLRGELKILYWFLIGDSVFIAEVFVCVATHPGGGLCAVAAARAWVCMQLQAGMPCSTAAAAAETEEAQEVLVQPSSSTESPAGTHHTLFIPGSKHMQV